MARMRSENTWTGAFACRGVPERNLKPSKLLSCNRPLSHLAPASCTPFFRHQSSFATALQAFGLTSEQLQGARPTAMKCRAWLTWGSQENYHAAALLLSSGLNETVLLWQGQTAQVRTLQWSNEPALPDKRSLSVPGNLQPVSQSIPICHCRQGPRSLQPFGCTEQLSCADFSLAGLDPRP